MCYSDVEKTGFQTGLDDVALLQPCSKNTHRSYDVSTLAVSEAQKADYLNMPWKSQYED